MPGFDAMGVWGYPTLCFKKIPGRYPRTLPPLPPGSERRWGVGAPDRARVGVGVPEELFWAALEAPRRLFRPIFSPGPDIQPSRTRAIADGATVGVLGGTSHSKKRGRRRDLNITVCSN